MKLFPFISFDTEDDSAELMEKGESGFKKQITQIAAIASNGDRFYNKGNKDEFLSWLKKRKETIIYAHNLQYDLGSLFGDSLDCLDISMVGGRLIKAVWNEKTFRDSFNLWPMALRKVGACFGLAKLEFNARSKTYVFRDCEIIVKAVKFAQKFAAEFDVELPATYGGLGMKVWRALGGDNWHDSSEYSLEAYYGGRVEIFKAGGIGNIFYTDINSLYPYCLTKEYPDDLHETNELTERYGIATVTIIIPKSNWIAPLPVRQDDGRIIYPIGKFKGTWTFHEIRYAVNHFGAKVVNVHKAFATNSGQSFYRDFVLHCYNRRKQARQDAEKTFWKFVMNSFYGRLGLSGIIGRSVYATEDNFDDGILYGSKVLVNYKMPLERMVNYCHVAHVTSYARIHLLDFIRKVGRENMIYCDTDSCIFFGKEVPFAVGNELGQMKLVSTASKCDVYLPKTYEFNGEFKAKGVPVSKAKEYILTGHTEFDLPFKLREAITFYDRENKRKLSIWRKVKKVLSAKYDKKKLVHGEFLPIVFNGDSAKRTTK